MFVKHIYMVKFINFFLILFLGNSVLSQFNGGGGAGTFANNLTILNCGFFSRGGGGSGSSVGIKHRDISCNSYFGNSGSGALALLLKRDMECNMYMGDSVSGYKQESFKRVMECNMYMGETHSGANLFLFENPYKCIMYTASLNAGSGFDMHALSMDTIVCPVIPLGEDCSPLRGAMNGNKGVLDWYTEKEYRNSGFELYRSYDGFEWERITWLSGQGTSWDRTNYQYIDKNTLMSGQYYKFKQIDFDGNAYWSNIVFLNGSFSTNGEELYTVFPNPSISSNTITIKSWAKIAKSFSLEIIDVSGNTVFKDSCVFSKNNGSYHIASDEISAGYYYIKMVANDDDGEYVIPFVVIK